MQLIILFIDAYRRVGTGAGGPSVWRNPSATAIRCPNTTFLFDCGEGTLRQIMQSQLTFSDIQVSCKIGSRPISPFTPNPLSSVFVCVHMALNVE